VTLLLLGLSALPAAAQGAADIMLRLDRMEAENRRLNGQVEQLGNQVRKLEDQLQRFQKDVDFRFKEGGAAAGPAPATGAKPQKKSDAFDPAASPGSPGAPRTIGQLAAEVSGTPPGRSSSGTPAAPDAPASLSPGDKPQATTTPTAPAGTARGDYEIARNMLDRGEYEASEMAFREFLKKHGKDRLKVDAIFGLGETFYRRNRYREAAEQYLQITTDSPKAARAAEAMLKLGMSLRGLGATPEACGTYTEVTKKYPNASAAIKQAVDREKKRAQCAA
jgi:tol-pal system protein YbgF